jgi:hypothetical protein
MVKVVKDKDGRDVEAGDVVRSRYTGMEYIIEENDKGELVGRTPMNKGRKITEIQISECAKMDRPKVGQPPEERDPFSVIKHLKDREYEFDRRVKLHDRFIRDHSVKRSKTPQSELDRHEAERDYYADARDQIGTAVQILEDVL